jgi:para-nitrobenzyl esterase
VKAFLRPRVGKAADEVLNMYMAEDRAASPFLIQCRIISDQGRGGSFTMAERKATQGKAPAYVYLWKAPSPAWDGRYGATHATDVGPSMHEVRGALHGPNANSARLSDELASVMVSFATTGDPNNKYLPKWEPYESTRRMTMVFDNPASHVDSDARGEFRKLWLQYPAGVTPRDE